MLLLLQLLCECQQLWPPATAATTGGPAALLASPRMAALVAPQLWSKYEASQLNIGAFISQPNAILTDGVCQIRQTNGRGGAVKFGPQF